MKPENLAIRRLRACGRNVDQEYISYMINYFKELRKIEYKVNMVSPYELREGHWAILGLLSRAYQLSICCIEMLASMNWNGYYAGARGLAEAVAAVAWASEKTERLPELVRIKPINIGKVLNSGYVRHPGLNDIYKKLSNSVHPTRQGHLLGFYAKENNAGIMTSFSMDYSDSFFQFKINVLITFAGWFIMDMHDMISKNDYEALKQGRIVVSYKQKSR